MLTGLAWLALEVKYVDRARPFYEERLRMPVREETASELTFEAGETDLVLRRPSAVPRGGLHTHVAFSLPAEAYDEWWDRLGTTFDLEETRFGSSRSLYLYDPDGNCVELGERDVDGPGIDGVFEIALEIESLERAEGLYADVGFETVDRGTDRRRVRMDGPMALELWEPQLGIADARGGVHVDLGFRTDDVEGVVDAVGDRACSIERTTVEQIAGGDRDGDREAVVVRDPDGHHLTFLDSGG